MSRTIRVKVENENGYGLSGYKVKTYGGDVVITDKNGYAAVEATGNSVSIYVNGTEVYSGLTKNCDSPLYIKR